ncbi:MAG TPA: SpoIID/LytB domain-containing protein [Solirubrobacteraceae bacterium]|jgi:stage II sporulation protein D
MPLIAPTYHRPARVPARPRRLLATLAAALAALACSTSAAGAYTLIVEGAGDGDGVGMSQVGALGFAQHGASYTTILAHYYTGTTIGLAPVKAVVRVLVGSHVMRVPLERYVRGVVAAEMPSSWPAAALEAQAVASRTYALTSHAGGSRFDVYSDTRSQVYAGKAAETAQTNAAVRATAGQLVDYSGRPVATYFFASSGGQTENIEDAFLGAEAEPWLKAVADPYETKATSAWKVTMSFAAVGAHLQGHLKGTFRGIEVLTRGASPRVVSARVLGSRGTTPIDGPELAGALGLNSTWAYFGVQSRRGIKREPDHSGRLSAGAAPVPASPPAAPAATGPQGGAQAPGSTGAATVAGGVPAG